MVDLPHRDQKKKQPLKPLKKDKSQEEDASKQNLANSNDGEINEELENSVKNFGDSLKNQEEEKPKKKRRRRKKKNSAEKIENAGDQEDVSSPDPEEKLSSPEKKKKRRRRKKKSKQNEGEDLNKPENEIKILPDEDIFPQEEAETKEENVDVAENNENTENFDELYEADNFADEEKPVEENEEIQNEDSSNSEQEFDESLYEDEENFDNQENLPETDKPEEGQKEEEFNGNFLDEEGSKEEEEANVNSDANLQTEQDFSETSEEKPENTSSEVESGVDEQDVPDWLKAVPEEPWLNEDVAFNDNSSGNEADFAQNTQNPENKDDFEKAYEENFSANSSESGQSSGENTNFAPQVNYSYSVDKAASEENNNDYVYHQMPVTNQPVQEEVRNSEPAVFDHMEEGQPYLGVENQQQIVNQIPNKSLENEVFNEEKFLSGVEDMESLKHKENIFDKVNTFLAQAGLSIKSVIVGALVLVLILIALVYGIYWGLGFLANKSENVVEKPLVQESSVPIKVSLDGEEDLITGLNAGEKFGYYLPDNPLEIPGTAVTAVPVPATGIEVGVDLGKDYLTAISGDFQQKILTLREMQNAFEADIYKMMDASDQRYTVLTNHINLMKLLEQKAINNMSELNVQIAELQAKYNEVTAIKNTNEATFFARLKELNPMASESSLDQFIEYSRIQNELKANYSARQKILRYHQLLLENLSNRRRDYELNIDALVRGVKVVDVSNSDIGLILKDE